MNLPVEGIGVGAVSGGVVIFIMKMLPILMRKINGKKNNNKNRIKPGFGKECIKKAVLIGQHDVAIKQLCKSYEDSKEQAETMRKENREDHNTMFEKLDKLREE